jgi:hypothetical protein
LQNKATRATIFQKREQGDFSAMIDVKTLAHELQEARAARFAAEDACCDVEELLWEVQHGPRYWRRLAQVDAGEPQPSARAH